MNEFGNYNVEEGGVLTKKFLTKITTDKASKKAPHYLVVNGYFNTKNGMSLEDVLNHMHSRGYKFKEFISNERNINAEMIFERSMD